MKKNMGTFDRIVRIAIALIIVVLFLTGQINGALSIILLALAAIFLLTSLVNFCPLYSLIGIKTCKIEKNNG
jgi:hypothetical protein